MLLTLCIESVLFDKVREDNSSTVVLFHNKSIDSQELNILSKLEGQSKFFKFYSVDSQDVKNKDVFDLPEFQQLPQIFVFSTIDGVAEKLKLPLTEERIRKFLALKSTAPTANLESVNTLDEQKFTIFVAGECEGCEIVLNYMSRLSQVLNETFHVINCEQTPEICEKVKFFENFLVLKDNKFLNFQSLSDLIDLELKEWKGQSVRAIKNYREHSFRLRIQELEERLDILEKKLEISRKDEL